MARTVENNPRSGQEQQPDQAAPLLLDKRYRILRLLGEGGMGSVHLAEHVGLKTQVAVKFLHLDLAGQGEALRRFEQEARVAASIRHNNIIQVFDVGFSDAGDPFLVMEYLEGESLGGLLKRTGPMDLGAACGVIEPILSALQAANRKGIIHRDLKPDNIFLAHQTDAAPIVKIIDFGLSKITTNNQELSRTQTGSILGTPAYMSPEQAMGSSSIDHRTDLYSLGTMLFEMLAGGLPYAGQNFTEFFAKLLTEEPRSPRDVYPGFPVEAEPLVRKAIRKKPEERFQSASEMLEALAQLPGFATRAESLARVSSGMVRKSFAAGDLGEGEWHTKKKRDSAYTTSRARPDAQGGQLSQATTDVATKRRSRLGVVVVATLVLLVVAFGLWKWTSPGASASATGNLPAPPSLPAPDQPPSATATPPPAASKTSEPIVPAPSLPESTAKPAEPKGAAARGKKSRPGPTQLRRGGRGTVMSEQFE